MFRKLLPKETLYFESFREMVEHLSEMADLALKLFSADKFDKSIILDIKPIEKRCDEITKKIFKRLNQTYITPFDREDIFNLIKRLDDIGDILYAAVIRVELFNRKEKIKYADDIVAIIVKQLDALEIALRDLKVRHINECKAVKDLETEVDSIYHQAIKELFLEEKDAIELIKKKEILSILEDASDKCQSAANVILAIFIKNA
ncbi:MAG: DUF47 domain-containing protein [Ignavibacteriales bacterium CG12_big_fil_rev_8_21_14_0_65_30_8]|nr:MAG: DUF47 domain-containing protein [Ignavibacteriales bacterium CG12_big_fil_rev_8_21_14_0_65_30_8]